MMNDEQYALPGDIIGTIEQFSPGKGTYEMNGNIYSAIMGRVIVNRAKMEVWIKPFKTLPVLKRGDIVYARVIGIREFGIVVRILKIEGINREICGDTEGYIHVSKISREFVDDPRKTMRIGDIIRASVIQGRPVVQLTTSARHLGVVLALCTKCRRPLTRKGHRLYCTRCRRYEDRKIASDYRAVKKV
ncbi:MAG: RNA-binding protein [Thermoplasmata archaeon]|nr:MAG: RNA-binding protein [Thermoplasmata archaeon]